MTRPEIKIVSNLLILASSQARPLHASQLVHRANQKFFERDYDSLAALARQLLEMSPQTEAAGLYYQALAICRDRDGGQLEARKIFEALANHPTPTLRALSLAGLASDGHYHFKQPTPFSWSLLTQVAQITYDCGAYLPFFQSQSELSVHRSLSGDHHSALMYLKGIAKGMKWVKTIYPAAYGDYLNDLAYELAFTGELVAAQHYIGQVLASPFAQRFPARFPVWFETQAEINEKLQQQTRNRSTIVVPPARESYEHCYENLYRLNTFYEYRQSRDEKARISDFRKPPSAPLGKPEGAYEVQVIRFGKPYLLYAIAESKVAPYVEWLSYLCDLPASPTGDTILEVSFNTGSRQFIFEAKAIDRALLRAISRSVTTGGKAPARRFDLEPLPPPDDDEVREHTRKILEMIAADEARNPPTEV